MRQMAMPGRAGTILEGPDPRHVRHPDRSPRAFRHLLLRRSRARRWHDAVAELTDLQAQYAAWLAALPTNLQDSVIADALQAICNRPDDARSPNRRRDSGDGSARV